jgi:hypothetical protein
MRRLACFLLILFSAVGIAPAQNRAPDRAQLDTVTVHLFLTKAGTLSEDVATIEGFGARNFSVQGKGLDLNDRFYSILIKVRLTSAGEVFAKGPQAEVLVTDRRTKKVVKRERIADVYIGSHGWTIHPIWIADAACGPLEIVATGGGKKISTALESTCGE